MEMEESAGPKEKGAKTESSNIPVMREQLPW